MLVHTNWSILHSYYMCVSDCAECKTESDQQRNFLPESSSVTWVGCGRGKCITSPRCQFRGVSRMAAPGKPEPPLPPPLHAAQGANISRGYPCGHKKNPFAYKSSSAGQDFCGGHLEVSWGQAFCNKQIFPFWNTEAVWPWHVSVPKHMARIWYYK